MRENQMKKVLFATTALVASAGIASAQGVEISGSAEMGIIGGDGIETQFMQSVDVRFSMSGETDNGLTFGATIDLDDTADSANNRSGAGALIPMTGLGDVTGFADFTVFISGSFGTLTMGDTDGALDWAMTEVNIGGSIADNETGHAGFNGNGTNSYDSQIVRYDYSFGDFAFAVSAELDDTGVSDPNLGIGFKYSGDLGGVTLGVGLGYEFDGVVDYVGVSLTAKMDNGFEARFNYSDFGTAGMILDHSGIGGLTTNFVDSHMAIGVGYTMDAITVGANYGVYNATIPGWADSTGFGLAVDYDLGGGAVVQFGYGSSSVQNTLVLGDTVSTNTFSLGLAMSF
jgi:outer membrane protein OmpU